MDLLIEASAPGVLAPPGASAPGTKASDGTSFGDVLQGLLTALPGPSAPVPSLAGAPDYAAPSTTSEPGEDGESPAEFDGAVFAAMALLLPGLVAPGFAESGDTTAAPSGPAGQDVTMTPDGEAPVAGVPPPVTEADPVEAAGPDSSAPGLEEGESPPSGAPPDGSSPGPDQTLPANQQSVVRLVGNAQPGTAEDADSVPVTSRPGDPSAVAQPAAGSQPASALPATTVVDSPAAPPPPLPIAPAAQVATAVVERVAEGGGEVRLRLDPPELGEILIRVSVEGGEVRVDVHADNAEAVRLLREATPGLSTLLGERGLGLVDVSVGQGDGGGQRHAFDEGSHPGRNDADAGSFAALLGIDPSAGSRQHNLVRATYNPDGAFMYRI